MAKTYKCTNYGICTEADKGTVFQETDLEEVDGKFVCPKCGQALEEIEKKPGVNGKLIAIIAAALVAAGGTVYIACFKGKSNGGNDPALGIDTIVLPPADTPKVDPQVDTAKVGSGADTEKPPVPPQPEPSQSTSYNLGWGIYEGPMKGGKPDGLGGEVRITKSYKIDMKDGSYKQVTKGDRLVNTKFKGGKLVQGYIHHPGGTQESFTIGY